MPDQTTHNRFYLRAENYWIQSRRPVVSLVFIAPLLVIYEGGVLLWGVQNGADAWMRQFLDLMGFSQHLLLPLLTVCVLLCLALLDPRTVAIFPERAIAHGRRMPLVGYMSASGFDFSGNIIVGDRYGPDRTGHCR